jgi:hypothetical protein
MLPTAPPAMRAEFTSRELDSRDATRAAASAGLPSPGWAARRFAMALCEVEAGMRPAAQLERACHHTLFQTLEERVQRSGGPSVSTHSLVDVITQEQLPGLVDAVVLVRSGPRVAAVTMRLDAAPGHWQVTELQYGRTPEWERARTSPTRASGRGTDRRSRQGARSELGTDGHRTGQPARTLAITRQPERFQHSRGGGHER